MPRIPGPYDARPTPRVSRSLATVRNRGGVAEAAGQLGASVSQLAGQALEKQDKLAYASAKAAYLKADIQARTELQDDPDYGTFEARYNERMAKAREAAAKLIQSRSDRSMFEADVGVDYERGLGQVKQAAHGKMVVAEGAKLDQGLFDLQDVYQSAQDEGTRTATLTAANDMIQGALTKGILDPQKAGDLRRSTGQAFEARRITGLLESDQIDEARTAFEKARGRLGIDAELALERVLVGREQGRQGIADAEQALADLATPVPVTAPGTKAPSEPGIPRTVPAGGGRVAFMQRVRGAESSGNDRAKNAASSASGRYQFTKDTWERLGGDWSQRFDAGEQERLMRKLTDQNEAALKRAGIPLTEGNYYLAHFAGAGGARALHANPNTPVESILGAEVVKANPFLKGMKGRDVIAWAAKKMGGSPAAGYSGDVTDVPSLGDAYGRLDARAAAEGWSPERLERAKEQVSVEINRAKAAENQARDEAYETAYAKAEAMGEGFTDVSQLGADYWRASPEQRRSLKNQAEVNLRAAMGVDADVDPDGRMATALEIMAIEEPDRFTAQGHDLRQYAGKIDKSKLNALIVKQAKMRQGDDETKSKDERLRSGITGAINWMNDYGGVKIAGDDKVRAFNWMEAYLRDVMGRKGTLQQSDYTEAMRLAVKQDAGTGDRYYQVLTDIPASFRKDFVRNWKGPRVPTEAEIIAGWQAHVVARRRR